SVAEDLVEDRLRIVGAGRRRGVGSGEGQGGHGSALDEGRPARDTAAGRPHCRWVAPAGCQPRMFSRPKTAISVHPMAATSPGTALAIEGSCSPCLFLYRQLSVHETAFAHCDGAKH